MRSSDAARAILIAISPRLATKSDLIVMSE